MIRGLRTHEGGFSLVELIIVLSVSLALLGSALVVFRGRVPRTQFASAVNTLNVELTEISNQVANGFYPNSNNFTCENVIGLGLRISPGSNEQGTNEDCIYLGQAVQFGVNEAPNACSTGLPDDRCGQINVYTVFGKRLNGTEIVTKLADAEPLISDINVTSKTLGYGTYVTAVKIGEGISAPKVGGIAYILSFGGAKLTGSDDPVGAPQVGTVPMSGSTQLGLTETDFISNAIGSTTPPNGIFTSPNPKEGITVCLRSGGSDQYAVLRLAIDGRSNISEPKILEKAEWEGICN